MLPGHFQNSVIIQRTGAVIILYQFPNRRLHNPYLQSPSLKHGRGVWGVDAKRLLLEWANVAAKQRIDITAACNSAKYTLNPEPRTLTQLQATCTYINSLKGDYTTRIFKAPRPCLGEGFGVRARADSCSTEKIRNIYPRGARLPLPDLLNSLDPISLGDNETTLAQGLSSMS